MTSFRSSPGATPFLAGVFLICMCGLMLQIVETRIISVISYYHMAFFAISMAMLGMTAGSLFVHFKSHLFPSERLYEHLVWISAAFAVALFLSTLVLITFVGTANTWVMITLVWFKLIIILLPPYFFGGMAISLSLTRSPVPVGIVYGIDLLGASSGCILILLLLEWADAISLLIAISALAAMASVCFRSARQFSGQFLTGDGHSAYRWGPGVLAASLGLIALGNAMIQPTKPNRWHDGLVLLSSKGVLELSSPALMRWNTYSRIMVSPDYKGQPILWAASPTMPRMTVSERDMNIDGAAATAMYGFSGDLRELEYLKYDLTNLAFAVRNHGKSAVIGVGGGRDILSAYLFGFRDITGVELNQIFIDLLTGDLRNYNRLADLPGVKLHVDEARSWFARTNEKFDLIEMSLVDTWAATGAGAYSLSENGLYTAQGWRHFLAALSPTGVFTVSRWYNPGDEAEIGRLLSLAAAALRNHGVDRPERHLFLAGSDKLATLIVANSQFTTEELRKLRARTESLKFHVLLSPDQLDPSQILTQIVLAQDPEGLEELSNRQHLNLTVTTDDRPFFFNLLRTFDPASISRGFRSSDGILHGNVAATIMLFTVMTLSALLVIFTMLFPSLPSVRQTGRGLAQAGTLYFLLLGFGFMFVEMGLIQRLSTFLGHPVYGLAIGLFGIIVSTGLGSLSSEYFPLNSYKRIATWTLIIGSYLTMLPFWFPSVILNFEGHSLIVRVLVALTTIVPSGSLMGYGFPTGMRMVNAIDSVPTPWFWAVNGAAGVFASGLAVVISIAFSINASMWLGAAAYILLAPIGLWLHSLSQPKQMVIKVPAFG
jgi:spermidine synthase